jgi:hypothetical protein
MLFSTSLVALILSPRHLVIQNTKVRVYDIPSPVPKASANTTLLHSGHLSSASSPSPQLSSPFASTANDSPSCSKKKSTSTTSAT